jgi:hypothetical protein
MLILLLLSPSLFAQSWQYGSTNHRYVGDHGRESVCFDVLYYGSCYFFGTADHSGITHQYKVPAEGRKKKK